jgi:hypothetical protein
VRVDFRGPDIGDFVYHCHILGHEDNGMMAIVRVLPANNSKQSNTTPRTTAASQPDVNSNQAVPTAALASQGDVNKPALVNANANANAAAGLPDAITTANWAEMEMLQ